MLSAKRNDSKKTSQVTLIDDSETMIWNKIAELEESNLGNYKAIIKLEAMNEKMRSDKEDLDKTVNMINK